MEIVILDHSRSSVDCIKIPEEVAEKIDNVEDYLKSINYDIDSISFMVGDNIMLNKRRALNRHHVVDYKYLFKQ